MTLIGIGGALRAGKDTIADQLVEDYGFVKTGVSDALNDAMMALNPVVPTPHSLGLPDGSHLLGERHLRYAELVRLVGYVEAKRVPEVRRLLQALGTEVGRNMFGEDIWVDVLLRRIHELSAKGAQVIVPGVRFPNELELIHNLGGISLYVTREGYNPQGSHTAHLSETSVSASDFSEVIANDGDLDHLRGKVHSFAHRSGLTMSPASARLRSGSIEQTFEDISFQPPAKESK